MPAIPNTLVPCRDGDWLLITTSSQYWGKGATIARAKAALRDVAGRANPAFWHVYSVEPETYLDDMGTIRAKQGHPPLLTAAWDPPQPQ